MKAYKRNPMLKVICGVFILAHFIIGERMVSTDNIIMGSIVIAVSLFWIFSLINEFTPYIKMDDKSLLVYSNFMAKPRKFVFNKELQMYYHTRERLVFTYLDPRGIREKARVHLGYMSPEVSTDFVQEFRQVIDEFHPEVREEQVVVAETAVVSVTETSEAKVTEAEVTEVEVTEAEVTEVEVTEVEATKAETTKAETTKAEGNKAKNKGPKPGSKKVKTGETRKNSNKTTKVNTPAKTAKKKKGS